MSGCGCGSNTPFDGISDGYKRVLVIIIIANAAMFVVEVLAGVHAQSMALQADALDFLGDSLTYGISLWAIGRPLSTRAKCALVKGISLGVMALVVFGATVYQTFTQPLPDETTMGLVGFLALAVNVAAALMLLRYRDGDSNVRSVWLCSRNDALGNIAVMIAALLVALTASPWPDLGVAFLMAGLFMHSSVKIIGQARAELRDGKTACPAPDPE